jgi:hypothetical protein
VSTDEAITSGPDVEDGPHAGESSGPDPEWVRGQRDDAVGVRRGLNSERKQVTRRSDGFRTLEVVSKPSAGQIRVDPLSRFSCRQPGFETASINGRSWPDSEAGPVARLVLSHTLGHLPEPEGASTGSAESLPPYRVSTAKVRWKISEISRYDTVRTSIARPAGQRVVTDRQARISCDCALGPHALPQTSESQFSIRDSPFATNAASHARSPHQAP